MYYYAVNADNGFGIYDNYKLINANKEYMKNPIQVKEFSKFSQAVKYSVDYYNDYQDDFDAYFDENEIDNIKINWFYYRTHIIRSNKELS